MKIVWSADRPSGGDIEIDISGFPLPRVGDTLTWEDERTHEQWDFPVTQVVFFIHENDEGEVGVMTGEPRRQR